jgi:hypothetical protein
MFSWRGTAQLILESYERVVRDTAGLPHSAHVAEQG